jgi:hypothetical protein
MDQILIECKENIFSVATPRGTFVSNSCNSLSWETEIGSRAIDSPTGSLDRVLSSSNEEILLEIPIIPKEKSRTLFGKREFRAV